MSTRSSSSPTLTVKLKDATTKQIDLTDQTIRVGRKPDNDLVIEDPAASSRHARITKVQAVYFVEDLNSTNGTFVNGKKVDRHQLRDADVIEIGRHRLIFRDEKMAEMPPVSLAGSDQDRTVILTGRNTRPASSAAQLGTLRVVKGKTDRQNYELTKQVTVIGAEADATVKMTGWFAPKVAALVARRGTGYYISPGTQGEVIRVNDEAVDGQVNLKDGDLVEVAGLTFLFSLKLPRAA
jgi:pSer/pThr/pTyr-binding forkhead associated (FHA) protein